jgi:hypothetical protein
VRPRLGSDTGGAGSVLFHSSCLYDCPTGI